MARWEPNARGRLIGAAMDLFAERGYDETTACDIASAAGVTERTFFRHFADKREVLFDPTQRLMRVMVATIADAPADVEPLDVVLATNMVSVGVDVQRLGVMAVSGQPKATAEYIQATSRVGRQWPGFVVTVLNWARPRDLSHYEQFEQYHAVFYRYVEALSVTPFAPRALDRGLAGVLASLVRLGNDGMSQLIEAMQRCDDHFAAHKRIESVASYALTTDDAIRAVTALAHAAATAGRLDVWLEIAQKFPAERLEENRDAEHGPTALASILAAAPTHPLPALELIRSLAAENAATVRGASAKFAAKAKQAANPDEFLADARELRGIDVFLRVRDLHPEDLRRAEEPIRVVAQAEDRRPVDGLVRAHAFEHSEAVVQRVREHVRGGVAPRHHLAVIPDPAIAVGHRHRSIPLGQNAYFSSPG